MRYKMMFLLLVPIAVQLIGLGFVLRLDVQERVLIQEEQETSTLIKELRELEKLMVDAETGTRGYVATGDERFLEPYLAASQAIPAVLRQIELRNTDGDVPVRRLRTTADELLRLREQQVRQVRSGNPVTAEELLDGKRKMDSFRAAISGAMAAEQSRLERRRNRLGAALENQTAWLVGLLFLNLVLVSVIWYFFSQTIRERVERVVEHARALHSREMIDAPLQGTDEFAEIDQILADAAEQISFTSMALTAEREEAEARARSSGHFIDRLFQSTSSLALVLDTDGRITKWSREFERLTALDASTLSGARFWEIAKDNPALPSVREAFENALRGDIAETYEWPIMDANGVLREIEWRGTVLFSNIGMVSHVVATGVDVTEQRKSEKRALDLASQIAAAEKVESLGRTAAKVAHEFNNVLMGIQPHADLLQRIGLEDPRAERAVEQIRRAVQRGAATTRDILRFARPATIERRPESFGEIIGSVDWETVACTECGIDIDVEEDLPPVLIDRHQIHQALTNLIVNASQAMLYGGRIRIAARRAPDRGRFDFGYVERSTDYLWVTVEDEGAGIPAEILHRIFEPMFTTKARGNGIGLAVCHQIIRSHGGWLFVQSEEGVGTAFHIFLPFATSDTAAIVHGESFQESEQSYSN